MSWGPKRQAVPSLRTKTAAVHNFFSIQSYQKIFTDKYRQCEDPIKKYLNFVCLPVLAFFWTSKTLKQQNLTKKNARKFEKK